MACCVLVRWCHFSCSLCPLGSGNVPRGTHNVVKMQVSSSVPVAASSSRLSPDYMVMNLGGMLLILNASRCLAVSSYSMVCLLLGDFKILPRSGQKC